MSIDVRDYTQRVENDCMSSTVFKLVKALSCEHHSWLFIHERHWTKTHFRTIFLSINKTTLNVEQTFEIIGTM